MTISRKYNVKYTCTYALQIHTQIEIEKKYLKVKWLNNSEIQEQLLLRMILNETTTYNGFVQLYSNGSGKETTRLEKKKRKKKGKETFYYIYLPSVYANIRKLQSYIHNDGTIRFEGEISLRRVL